MSKAIEFDVAALLETAKKNYKLANTKNAKYFNLKADIHYYYLKDELNIFVKNIEKYFKLFGKKKPQGLLLVRLQTTSKNT